MSNCTKVALTGGKILAGLLSVVLMHGITGVWWASNVNTRVSMVETRYESLHSDVKTNTQLLYKLVGKDESR